LDDVREALAGDDGGAVDGDDGGGELVLSIDHSVET